MSEHRPGAPEPIDREIDVRAITRVTIWLVVITVAGFAISIGYYWWLERGERAFDAPPSPIAEAAGQRIPPGPRLQSTPGVALREFEAAEETRLGGWGWVDRAAGVAHVPVERAIDEVAGDGALPSFVPPAPAEAAP
jgi:hypothetical protein